MVGPMLRVEINDRPLPAPAPGYGAGQVVFREQSSLEVRVERRYAYPSIGVVTGGMFDYAARAGRATAARGAVVFGSGTDDFRVWRSGPQQVTRCVVAVEPSLVAEVAADCGRADARFPLEVLPATRGALPFYGLVRRIAASPADRTEDVIRLLGLAFHAGGPTPPARVRPAQRRRIRDVAQALEDRLCDDIPLAEMAAMAGLSRYHFVRVFAAVMDETPHQHLIALRLRAAADRLIETQSPATRVALDVGFNDLSNFTSAFRSGFGASPRAWRKAAGASAARPGGGGPWPDGDEGGPG